LGGCGRLERDSVKSNLVGTWPALVNLSARQGDSPRVVEVERAPIRPTPPKKDDDPPGKPKPPKGNDKDGTKA